MVEIGAYADLRRMSFQKQKLTDVSFFGADLQECNFSRCVLRRCDFINARITNACFEKADLRDSSFGGNDLLHANFKEARIDLEQAVIFASALGVVYTP